MGSVPDNQQDQKISTWQQHNLPQANVFLNYLPSDLTDDGLLQLCAPYGTILHAKVVKVNQTSLGYGFVQFSQGEEAQSCIQALNNTPLSNKTITLRIARPQSKELSRANVYIAHLPLHWSEEETTTFCSQFGQVIELRLLHATTSNEKISRGVCFCRFNSHQEAMNAVEAINGYIPQQQKGSTTPVLPLQAKIADVPAIQQHQNAINAKHERQQRHFHNGNNHHNNNHHQNGTNNHHNNGQNGEFNEQSNGQRRYNNNHHNGQRQQRHNNNNNNQQQTSADGTPVTTQQRDGMVPHGANRHPRRQQNNNNGNNNNNNNTNGTNFPAHQFTVQPNMFAAPQQAVYPYQVLPTQQPNQLYPQQSPPQQQPGQLQPTQQQQSQQQQQQRRNNNNGVYQQQLYGSQQMPRQQQRPAVYDPNVVPNGFPPQQMYGNQQQMARYRHNNNHRNNNNHHHHHQQQQQQQPTTSQTAPVQADTVQA